MSLKLRYDTLVSDVIHEPENIKISGCMFSACNNDDDDDKDKSKKSNDYTENDKNDTSMYQVDDMVSIIINNP
tara:strand:+ start:316 stop:534 length:219 start_codon:yes stop_codon:yes gene_type:complete